MERILLNSFKYTSQYMGGIMSYVVLGIAIFSGYYGDVPASELGQIISNFSFKSQYLIYLFTRLYDILNELTIIAGNTYRVGELIENMSSNTKKYKNGKNQIMPTEFNLAEEVDTSEIDNSICLVARNLTIMVPDEENNMQNRILVKNLSFDFKEGENILITGRSGCGKTSLFRCINGMWKSYEGIIEKNHDLFFLPQNSYFTSGSLLEQIMYPLCIDNPDTQVDVVQITELLKRFNLGHLLNKVNNDIFSKPSFYWTDILSGGEKQRLAFLRLVYHKPRFALLDEISSSVDQETETEMYDYLKIIKCTYMTIAHRDTVKKFHNLEIKFETDTSYKIFKLK